MTTCPQSHRHTEYCATYEQMLTQCEEIDRQGRIMLDANPHCPRYCYTCQQWLDNAMGEVKHAGHSIH
jgi:hypothetical protein